MRQRLETEVYVGYEVSVRDAPHQAVVLIKYGTLVPSALQSGEVNMSNRCGAGMHVIWVQRYISEKT